MDIDIQLIVKMRYDFLIGVVRLEHRHDSPFSSDMLFELASRLSMAHKKKSKTLSESVRAVTANVQQWQYLNNEISHSITAIANLFGRQFN